MIGALFALAVVFYALLYSGIANLQGNDLSTWDALSGATPAGGLTGPNASQSFPKVPKGGANPVGATVVGAARRDIGLGYRLGGIGPPAEDCSGLAVRAYAAAGIRLPHNAALIHAGCVSLVPSAVSPGDFAFYSIDHPFSHMEIVTDPGHTLIGSAPSYGGVKEHPYNTAGNEAHIVGYGRPRGLVSKGVRQTGPKHSAGPHPKGGRGGRRQP